MGLPHTSVGTLLSQPSVTPGETVSVVPMASKSPWARLQENSESQKPLRNQRMTHGFFLTATHTHTLPRVQVTTSGLRNVLVPQGRASTEVPNKATSLPHFPKAKVTGFDIGGLGNKIPY